MASKSNHQERSEDYVRSLRENKELTEAYYRKSVNKTEQQKFLERLLSANGYEFATIADVACGAGTLSYHLSKLYPRAEFYLSDLNPDALQLAKEICVGEQFHFAQESMFSPVMLRDNHFDAVFCWQTLLLIDTPEALVDVLLRLTKKGGRIFLMALFNIGKDVDIRASIIDHTRKGLSEISYNTYSEYSVQGWLKGKAESFRIHPFIPETDFSYDGRGLGSSTVQTPAGRLQVSGGYLMNWALLEITK